MDIPRPDQAPARRKRRLLLLSGLLLLLLVLSFIISRLGPASPTIERSAVWIDTVSQGEMLREVRGSGALVPLEIRSLTARTNGRVERILLRPGAQVTPESVIAELSNPDVVQAADAADSQLHSAQAELTNLKIRLQSELLAMESNLAHAKSDAETARLQQEVLESLLKEGLASELETKKARVVAEEALTRHQIERKRYAFTEESIAPQLAIKEAEVERVRALARLRHEELDALNVRATMPGVLQSHSLEIGQNLPAGSVIARVVNPLLLKAEIHVPETQARDVLPGQLTRIDTRNGVAEGKVSRVDPAVKGGTVTVDIEFSGPLPKGARPDLSVEGVIELERLASVIHVGRPALSQEHSLVGVFLLGSDGSTATRRKVSLGRCSLDTAEVLEGLKPGDRIILSDMSQYGAADQVRLR